MSCLALQCAFVFCAQYLSNYNCNLVFCTQPAFPTAFITWFVTGDVWHSYNQRNQDSFWAITSTLLLFLTDDCLQYICLNLNSFSAAITKQRLRVCQSFIRYWDMADYGTIWYCLIRLILRADFYGWTTMSDMLHTTTWPHCVPRHSQPWFFHGTDWVAEWKLVLLDRSRWYVYSMLPESGRKYLISVANSLLGWEIWSLRPIAQGWTCCRWKAGKLIIIFGKSLIEISPAPTV